MILSPYRFAADASSGYLSPFYPTSLYSMRLRNASYAGACIRVKRSSDSTQQDIGFGTDGYLDEAALVAFVGAGTGYVKTWYDQSGSAVDLTDSGNSDAVIIVAAGVTWKLGGRAALRFDQAIGSGSVLGVAANATFAFGAGAWTWEMFMDPTSNSGIGQVLFDFRSASASEPAAYYNAAGMKPTYYDGANVPSSGSDAVVFNAIGHQAISYAGGSGGALKLYCYGAETHSTTRTISFSGNRPMTICRAYNASLPWTGLVVEARITRGAAHYTAAFTPPDYFA